MGLLAQVKATPKGPSGWVKTCKYDREEMIGLAIAFARKEITALQVTKVIGMKTGVHTLLATALMTALRNGRLEIPESWR